jgi:hypothetical protein
MANLTITKNDKSNHWGCSMDTEKKVWIKPSLLVLARGNPEESVLATCKGFGKSGTSATNNGGRTCYNPKGCSDCSNRTNT